MAAITQDDVEYVASLAQLTLDDEAKARLIGELDAILTYMKQLDEVDTTNVEPMMRVHEVANVFRDDTLKPSLDRKAVMDRAPKSDGEFFVAPKILEGEGGA